MIKKILIVVASLILLGFIYKAYCDHFWKNYNEAHFVYGEYDETDEITDFSFTAYPPIPPDTILSKKNFWKYEWRRKLIEPYHGQWINDLKLSFINDSTIFMNLKFCETPHPPIQVTVRMSFFHSMHKISFDFDFVLKIYFLKNPLHNFFLKLGYLRT